MMISLSSHAGVLIIFRWTHWTSNHQGARRSKSHWHLGGSSTGCQMKSFDLTLPGMRAMPARCKETRMSCGKLRDSMKATGKHGTCLDFSTTQWHPTVFDRSPRLIWQPHWHSNANVPRLETVPVRGMLWVMWHHGYRLLRPRPWRVCKNHDPVTNFWQQLVSQNGRDCFCMLQSLVRNQCFYMEIKRTARCYSCSTTRLRKFIPKRPSR